MKKFLIFVVVNFLFISVCFGQSITINSIGMHKDGEPGNFEVQPGDVVKVSVNYTTIAMKNVQNVNFEGHLGGITWAGYMSDLPNDFPDFVEEVTITNWVTGGIGTNKVATFKFIVPIDTGSSSFQIVFGLSGRISLTTTVHGTNYSSYSSIESYEIPSSFATGLYQSYLKIITVEEPPLDEETLPPTLLTPNSQTDATYDNSTLLIDFQLSEQVKSGSVKLYFSLNPDGSSPITTITLTNYYESTYYRQITLNGANLRSTYNVDNVEGINYFTHLNTYYVAVGYQDVLNNPEALSSWNKLIYDNQVDFSDNCWPLNFYSQDVNDITLTFNLIEPTKGDVILTIYDGSKFNRNIRTMKFSGYNFVVGENNLTIKGNNLLSSDNCYSLSPNLNSLISGDEYLYELTLEDLAGNFGTTNPSSSEIYYYNPEIELAANFSEVNSNSSFNSSLMNEYQDLGVLNIKIDPANGNRGVSKLTSLTFQVDPGSINSNKISNIRARIGETTIRTISYEGPKSYTLSGLNRDIDEDGFNLSFSFQIDYTNNTFNVDDFISMSLLEEGIETEGTITGFNTETASKKIKQFLIVDFENIQPSVPNVDSYVPFFRLELSTNDGMAQLNRIDFRVQGTILNTINHTLDDKIYLGESSSTIFDQNTSLGSKAINQDISFDFADRTISTIKKYYYFSVKLSANSTPIFTIMGNIMTSGAFGLDISNIVSSGFPLNSTTDEMTLPVELSSFTANFNLSDGVGLKWVTESEINVSGYHIYRNEVDSFDNSLRINPVIISNGIENGTQKIYSYVDDEVELNTDYYYWLECLEYDGYSDFYGPFKVYTDEDQIEDELEVGRPLTQLLSAYPNPFNPDVNIPYKLIENNSVEISIFNIKGQKVRSYFRDNQEPGNYSIYFDGKDDSGNRLSSGIYFYRMKTNTYSKTNKMILLK